MFEKIGTEIVSEGIFERFPDLVPAIGEKYVSDSHKKLLLIGESSYFPDNLDESKSVFKDAEKWYKGKNVPLIPEEKKNYVSNWIGEGYRTFDNFFKSMKNLMNEANIAYDKYLLQETGFYNYFLRPAIGIKGKMSFRHYCKPLDMQVSYVALCEIINAIEPDIVIFVSKYAWESFGKTELGKTKIEFVRHPAHPASWYNKDGNGLPKFEKLLKEYWLK